MAWCSCITAGASQPAGKPSDQSSTSLHRAPGCSCHSVSAVTHCVTAASFLVQGCVSSQLDSRSVTVSFIYVHLCTLE